MRFLLLFSFISLLLKPDTVRCQDTSTFLSRLALAAETLTRQSVIYDPMYYNIPYPNGDIPSDRGVCTDVVIRAYRLLGIDLQQKVHEDMTKYFHFYPKIWALKRTDKNIDHRRVPNLMLYFTRYGKSVALSNVAKDYQPGDIVCWNLGGGTTHIGIVSTRKAPSGRFLIVHNIGAGQVLEDCLFSYTMIGHYRVPF